MKGFRKLDKMLRKEGFELVKDGNHVIYGKGGETICVTRNVKNADKLFKKALTQWHQQVKMHA